MKLEIIIFEVSRFLKCKNSREKNRQTLEKTEFFLKKEKIKKNPLICDIQIKGVFLLIKQPPPPPPRFLFPILKKKSKIWRNLPQKIAKLVEFTLIFFPIFPIFC